MILFFAYTKSQLINAIVIASTEYSDCKCDLCYRNDVLIDTNVSILKEVFNKCYEIPTCRDFFKSKILNRFMSILSFNTLIRKTQINPNNYTKVFYSGKDYKVLNVFYAMKKMNKNLELILFEEGINEYYRFASSYPLHEKIYAKLIGVEYYGYCAKSLYVYEPQIVLNGVDIVLNKIPNYRNDLKIKKTLSDLFKCGEDKPRNLNAPIVFLDQIFDEFGYDEERYDKYQKEIIDYLLSTKYSENIYVKLHPRSKRNKYGNNINYLDINYPFELLALNHEMDNWTLISLCSSALINIKLIFDYEPLIISFNKIVIKDMRINNLFDRTAKMYKTNRFYNLDSIEEIKGIIT